MSAKGMRFLNASLSSQVQGTMLVVSIVLLCTEIAPVNPEAFTSIAGLRNLILNEDFLLDKLEEYLEQEEQRLDAIRSRMEELAPLTSIRANLSEESWDDYVTDLVAHPIDAFNVIKSWYEVSQLATVSPAESFREIAVQSQEAGIQLPQDQDYKGALAALVRLQKTYLLPSRELAEGRVYNVTALHVLDQADRLQMASMFMEVDHSIADSWLDLLLEDGVTENSIKSRIYRLKIDIYNKCGDTERALINAKLASHLEYNNEYLVNEISRLQQEWTYKQKQGLNQVQHYYWKSDRDRGLEYYESLCRGDNIKNTIFVNKDLICVYRQGILPYVLYKEEIHSFDPRISLLIDVISDSQADMLKEKAFPGLYRAQVGDPSKSFVSEERISKLAWLWDTDRDVERLSSRVGDMTGLATQYHDTQSDAEAFQIVNYGLGGQYEPHFDFYEHGAMLQKLPQFIMNTGDRIATFMYYLSEPQAGGATVFPAIGVRVPPIKNAAAFWYNFRLDGNNGDRRTLHAGCPVLLGQKWVGNKWIRQGGQTFKRPCALGENQQDPIWYKT